MGMTTRLLGTLLLALTMTAMGCGGDDDGGGGGDTDGGGGGGIDGGGGGTDGGGTGTDSPIAELCEGTCACSDGMDNDGDGLIDGMDPECTGPYDDDEGSFATGIPGDNRDPIWQDCFYDGNSGAGDDGCRYHTGCLTGEKESTDPDCAVTDMCLEFCKGRTPNGCDCFGCCEVTKEDGTVVTIQIGEGCSLDNIDDADACPPCTQDDECTNDCGTCELCPGRDPEDLPDECYDDPDGGTPMYECEDGITCMTSADCEGDAYCSLGCCLVGPI